MATANVHDVIADVCR